MTITMIIQTDEKPNVNFAPCYDLKFCFFFVYSIWSPKDLGKAVSIDLCIYSTKTFGDHLHDVNVCVT